MSSVNGNGANGREYWRSLDDLASTDEFREFMHREFPAGATDMLESQERRHFLKIMGASMALAGMGLAGCRRWPEQDVAPFASRPVGHTPGTMTRYATMREQGGVASGLLVTCYDGRPIKIEGNPEHPIGRGGTTVFDQASILDMYDPDRSAGLVNGGNAGTAEAFDAWAAERLAANRGNGGRGFRVLARASDSPTIADLRARMMQAMPQAKWYEWEPINEDNAIAGSRMAFGGAAYRPVHDLSQAKVIVSLDADFLGVHPEMTALTRDYAAGRKVSPGHADMNRLYVIEAGLSVTGANADQRTAVRRVDIAAVAAALAGRITGNNYGGGDAGAGTDLDHIVDDLNANRGNSVIIAGRDQPAVVHALAHAMNAQLGNVGTTVAYMPVPDAHDNASDLRALCDEIDAGSVDTLVVLGGNPVYDGPNDLDFASRIGKVANSVHLGDYVDETAQQCTWHVNRAHDLEAWGDGRAWDGTVCIRQPMILPLFEGRSDAELLATMIGDDLRSSHDLVRRTFASMTGGTFSASAGLSNERQWRRAVHDGILAGSAIAAETPSASVSANVEAPGSGTEVVLVADSSVYDGRFANNGWLQELPDPISKLTWDNALVMNPSTAEANGLSQGDVATLAVNGRSVEGAAMLVPGVAAGSVVIALGYGRAFEGRICPDAGFDAYAIRTTETMGGSGGASLTATGDSYPLATTQDHHAIDTEGTGGKDQQRRLPTLVREADLNEYKKDPHFAAHRTHVPHRLSLWEETLPHQKAGGEKDWKWGLSIDLNACTGCNSCVIACQAENNIPIVGKDQIIRGREMHWLRVDRYFKFAKTDSGWDENKLEAVAMQPMPCQQCENAPCEQVCPVAATVHDADGLNVMIYNRCVGTRYCSNNCPYKVRRFNYFDYHRRKPHRESPGLMHVETGYFTKGQSESNPLQELQFNPEVSVRMRGVMEKCTFCIQRINEAKIAAKNEWVRTPADQRAAKVSVTDGSIQTACQQACPAQAIVFGDLNDSSAQVSQNHRDDRAYEVLEELNTKPRTKYLAKLRNPHGGGSEGHGHGHGHGDAGHGEGDDH